MQTDNHTHIHTHTFPNEGSHIDFYERALQMLEFAFTADISYLLVKDTNNAT